MNLNPEQIKLKDKIELLVCDGIIPVTSIDDNIKKLDLKVEYLKSENYKKAEKNILHFFKALANTHRLKIISLLKLGVKCSCELEYSLKLSQPTISHHLKILEDSNIITTEAKGKWKVLKLVESPMIYWLLDQLKESELV